MKRFLSILLAAALIAGGIVIGANLGGNDMPTAEAASVSCSAEIVRVITYPEGATVANANRIIVMFADGGGYEFAGFEHLQDWILALQTKDTAERLAVAYWLARDDDGSNPNIIIGKTLTFDLSVPSPIKVR